MIFIIYLNSVHIAGASSGVTLSKSISTESITSGRTSKTGSSSLSNLSSISTPSPTALNNSATKPIQQNDATKLKKNLLQKKRQMQQDLKRACHQILMQRY